MTKIMLQSSGKVSQCPENQMNSEKLFGELLVILFGMESFADEKTVNKVQILLSF